MTPAEFRSALAALHWPASHVAEQTGYHRTIAAQWANGRTSVPPDVAEWLQKLLEAHRRLAPPKRRLAA